MSIINKIRYIEANSGNVGGVRTPLEIRYLVYHYTGNDGDTAVSNAKYYRDNAVKASAHYFVDDNEVVQSVGDLTTAWAVGGKKWSDCLQTGGGRLYGVVTNSNSISIEMCDVLRNGELMATEKTLQNAAELGRLLMERYSIPIERVVRHFDVTGKHCPAYFMDNAKWESFKVRLENVEQRVSIDKLVLQLTPEQAYKIYSKAMDYAQSLPLPINWDSTGELHEAISLGITDGTRPMCLATRLETAIMVKRAVDKHK